jgi:protein gp37
MSAKTGIEWTDATWNPVVGCSRVSAGCKNCYAFRMHDMRHKAKVAGAKLPDQYAHPFTTIQPIAPRISLPLMWKKSRLIFVNSTSDLFHEDVPFDFILGVWNTMALSPQHTYQILTKRARRMLGFFEWLKEGMRERGLDEWEKGAEVLKNVWLGVSVENQGAADERIPLLLQVPAAVRFLSCEPLLGSLDLSPYLFASGSDGEPAPRNEPPLPCLHWIIAGGESGPGARPMHPDWARALRDQCQAAGVPFFFKQWGEWAPVYDRDIEDPDWRRCDIIKARTPKGQWLNLAGGQGFHGDRVVRMGRVGKKAAGRLLDGVEWNEYPKPAPAGSRETLVTDK